MLVMSLKIKALDRTKFLCRILPRTCHTQAPAYVMVMTSKTKID